MHRRRNAVIAAALGLVMVLGVGAFSLFNDDSNPAAPGTIDDGKDLLPQATITLDQAIAAARAAEDGALGEVDLEYYNGQLVFNVDIGDHDVKVSAADGTVLGSGTD